MTQLLKFSAYAGAKSFKFKDPDTGHEFEHRTFPLLLQHIIKYRLQNKLPLLESLPAVVENYMCHLPENYGACVSRGKLKRGFLASVQGGVTVLENFMFKKFATKEVADARSEICAKCPYNVFPDKGGFIAWSDAIAEASTDGKKSKHHNELGNCDICSCPLRAKVFYGGKIELPKEQYEQLPEFCWQKKEIDGNKS